MKKFLIFVISLFLCLNNSMVVFAEEEVAFENDQNTENVEIIEDEENIEDIINEESLSEENEYDKQDGQQEETVVEQIDNEIKEDNPLDVEEKHELEQTEVEKLEFVNTTTLKEVPTDICVNSGIKITSDSDLNYLSSIREIRFYGCREENDDYIVCKVPTNNAINYKLYYNFSLFNDSDGNPITKYDDYVLVDLSDCIYYFENEYTDNAISNVYTIKIIADGYKDYTSNRIFSYNGRIAVTSPTIEVLNNGDLEVKFSSSGVDNANDDFLTGLTRNGEIVTAPDGTTRKFSSVIAFILPPDKETIYTSNINCNCYELNLTNHSLTIPKAVLQSLEITENQKIKMMFYVHGYFPTGNDVVLKNQEKNEEFYVSQDAKGDVYITSTNSDLLEYLDTEPTGSDDPRIYFMSGSTQYSITKKPDNINEHNEFYEILYGKDNTPESILIKKEVLLAHFVPSTVVEFSCNYNDQNYSNKAIIKACKDIPNDLVIEEKNDRLEISTSDIDFLKALIKQGDCSINRVSEEYQYINGSYIYFLHDEYEDIYLRNNKDKNGYVQEEIFFDEAKNVVFIPKEVLKGKFITSSDYTCLLSAYGYNQRSKPITLSNSLACRTDNISLTLEQDQTTGDLYISCENTDFINNLTKVRKYTSYPEFKTYEYGSSISLFGISNNTGKWYSFGNQKCDSQDDTHPYEIIKVSDTKVRIPFYTVLQTEVPANTEITKIDLGVFGYKTQTLDIDNYTIIKGVQNVPNDVNVIVNDNGDIVVSSNNIDYLKALSKTADNYNSSLSYISVQINDKIDNYRWFYNSIYRDELELNELQKTVTLSIENLLSSNVNNGLHKIIISAEGYSQYYAGEFEFANACINAPTGVTAQLSNGNLIIKSADTEWISNLKDNENSYIYLYNDDYFPYIYTAYCDATISKDEKTLTIPAKTFSEEKVVNGTYNIEINSYGYESVPISNYIKITNGVEPVPNDISIVENKDGTITISTNTTAYIDALSIHTVDKTYNNVNNNIYIPGSFIYIGDYTIRAYDWYDNGILKQTTNPFVTSKDKKTLTITTEGLIKAVGSLSNKYKNGNYRVSLNVPGYGYYTEYLTIEHSPINDEIPDDISIEYNPNVGLKISSSDVDWLKGIVNNNDDVINDSSTIRIYYDSSYQEAKNNNRWANFIGFVNATDDISILEGDGYVYIPTNELTAAFATFNDSDDPDYSYPNGNYHIIVTSYGYAEYEKETPIEINWLKNVPNDVSITQGNNIIIINSTNKDYLKQLTRECDNKTTWFNYINLCNDNKFNDDETYWLVNQEDFVPLQYDDVNKYAYFSLDCIKELCTYGDLDIDSIYSRIYTLGYGEYTNNSPLIIDLISGNDELVLGSATQLIFDGHGTVTWSSSDENIISVDGDGNVTANKLGTATIFAVGDDGVGDSFTIKVTSNSKVSISVTTNDKTTIANVGDTTKKLVITVKNYTFNPNVDTVTYSSSNDEIAEVDENGNITFKKAGVVTLYAEAIGKKASVKLSVYSVDKSKKLSASFNNPDEFFEVGDTGDNYYIKTMTNTSEEVNTSLLAFKSSNESIVSVDSDGKLTANEAGSATITVTLVGDPSSRKATCIVTVVDRVTQSIDKDKLDVEEIDNVISSHDLINNTRDVLIDYSKLVEYTKQDKNNNIHISIAYMAIDKNGDPFTPSKMTYQSSDTSIATVDAKGYVTFKKEGQVTITCVIASNPKGKAEVSQEIILRAINYAPKIETNKIVINKYSSDNSVPIVVHNILNSTIDECKITETNGDDSLFVLSKVEETNDYVIGFRNNANKQNVPAKSYNQLLQFKVNDVWYKYKVTVVVSSTLPTFSFKVSGNYNTYTNENTLELVPTVKNGTINRIDFVGDWASFSDGYKISYTKDAVTSGKIRVYFYDYSENGYIEKTIKLNTSSAKPTLKLDKTSISLYASKTFTVNLIDKNKNPITSGKVELIEGSLACSINNTDNKITDGKLTLTVDELKSGKINLYYYDTDGSGNNKWNDKIKLTISVSASTKLPTAKLSSTSLTLNTHYNTEDSVGISLSSISESVKDVVCNNIDNLAGIDTVNFADGLIKVKTNGTIGTYKLTLTPYMDDGSQDECPLKPVTLTVKVNADVPEFIVKSTTVTLNSKYNETILSDYSLNKNTYSKELIGIEAVPVTTDVANIVFNDNKMKFSLKEAGKALTSGSYKYTITPIFTGNVTGKPVTVTIKINNKAATAKITMPTAYNPLETNAKSQLKVALSNVVGDIVSIRFKNDDLANQLFDFDTTNKDTIKSTADNDTWKTIKDQTLKTKVLVKTTATGDNEIEADLSIKIARKAPTLKLVTTTVNVYDTTVKNTVVGESSFTTSGVTSEIKKNNIIISESLAYVVEYDDINDKIIVKLIDGAKLKSDSTQTFTIKVNWDNDYYNGKNYTKTSTVKLNVKDMSYSIKTIK